MSLNRKIMSSYAALKLSLEESDMSEESSSELDESSQQPTAPKKRVSLSLSQEQETQIRAKEFHPHKDPLGHHPSKLYCPNDPLRYHHSKFQHLPDDMLAKIKSGSPLFFKTVTITTVTHHQAPAHAATVKVQIK